MLCLYHCSILLQYSGSFSALDSFQAATVLPPLEGISSISGYGSSGRMSRSSSRAGCHGWDLHTGATSISDAFSSQTFLRHLQIRQKGEKAYPVPLAHWICKASIAIVLGSGLQPMYCCNWVWSKQVHGAFFQLCHYLLEPFVILVLLCWWLNSWSIQLPTLENTLLTEMGPDTIAKVGLTSLLIVRDHITPMEYTAVCFSMPICFPSHECLNCTYCC